MRQVFRIIFSPVILVLIATAMQGQSLSTMAFTEKADVLGGAPSLAFGGGAGILYIAYRPNDTSNSLYVNSTSDGVNLSGAVHFPGIVMDSDPSIALDISNDLLQVAFLTANQPVDYVTICSISLPLSTASTTTCTPFQTITSRNAPSILNQGAECNFGNNYGTLVVAYNYQSPNLIVPPTLGLFTAVNSPYNGHQLTDSVSTSVNLWSSPTVAGCFLNGSGNTAYTITVAGQSVTKTGLSQYSAGPLLTEAFNSGLQSQPVVKTTNSSSLPPYISYFHDASNGAPIVAFTSGSNNQLAFEIGLQGTMSSSPEIVNNGTQTGGRPAIAYWSLFSGYSAVSVAFKANDGSNRLMLGTITAASFTTVD